MTKSRSIKSLRPVVPVRPSDADANGVELTLERAAAGEIALYFEIPAHLVAVAGWFRKMATSFLDRRQLSSFRTYADHGNVEKARVAGLPFINYPERRPNARYVGLTRESVERLRIAGQASVHWFHETLEIATGGEEAQPVLQVFRPVDFVCLRPSSLEHPRGPIIEALSDCTFKVTLADLFVAAEPASHKAPATLLPDVLALRERAPGVAILHEAARAAYRAAEPSRAATMDQRVAEQWIAREGDPKLFNKTVLPMAWKSINTKVNRKQGRKPDQRDRIATSGALDNPFVQTHLREPHISDALAIATYIAMRHSQRRIEGHLRLREQVALDLCKYGFAGKGEREALERIITWPSGNTERNSEPPLPQDFVYD